MPKKMLALIVTTAIVTCMSTVVSQETSCELRDIKTLSVKLATSRNYLETMIEEKKKLILEEVKQIKYKTTQQATEIKTLDVNSLETVIKIEDMFKNLTALIKTKDTEIKERLGETMQNVTGLSTELNSLLNVTDGGWSLWSNWSECQVTCLGGLTRRRRTCNKPEPSIFGRDCVGNDEEVDICNSFTCPDIDDCIGHSCKNGATCVDGVYTYTCTCAAGFTGEQCETEIDECTSAPCKHNSTCVDRVAGYSCICSAGYNGIDCDTGLSCPGGACTNEVNGFRLCDGGGAGVCHESQGRLEYNNSGVWGTVCDDFWLTTDPTGPLNAKVACRSLGFFDGVTRPMAYFGEGVGNIWIDDIKCAGTESSLLDCFHATIGSHDCRHYEDQGVTCYV